MPWMQKAVDRPFGFRVYDEVLRVSDYSTDASVAAIYPGDLVIIEADGGLAVSAASSTAIVGAAVGYQAASTASTDFKVYDHPDQRFFAQDDGDTGIMTATSLGARCLIIATTGDTTVLQGRHEIDSSSAATTAANPISIHALHPVEDGSYATTTAQQRKWVCSVNAHFWSGYQQVGI